MTGGEGRKVENTQLNKTKARLREQGFSVQVTDLVDTAVRGRLMTDRTQAMADLLDLLGVVR